MFFNFVKIYDFLAKIFKSFAKMYIILFFSLYSCSVPSVLKPKKIDSNTPVNAKERARKNIEEGRGVSLKGAMGGRKSTTYEFSTSNPLWRASLETIDFMPLTTVDYSGGIIITDWYSDKDNPKEAIKITNTPIDPGQLVMKGGSLESHQTLIKRYLKITRRRNNVLHP